MCTLDDVIYSSYGPADEMCFTLREYGNGSMGRGIRRMTEESFAKGCVCASMVIVVVGLGSLGILKVKNKLNEKRVQLLEEEERTEAILVPVAMGGRCGN